MPTSRRNGDPLPQPQALPQFGTPTLEFGGHAVLLGLQQLEQQQTPLEQRRQYTPDHGQYQHTRQLSNPGFSDDERTEPSSTVTGNTGENPAGYTRSDLAATSTFGRLIQTTRKRSNTRDRKESGSDDDEGDDDMQRALIYGYLQKLGRNGKWQTRWFETDGECLTYYKSSKRTKLLATLDLAKVGSIVINHDDTKGCCFNINISERPYHLLADTKAACKDWVITLNRVKEARMQQGNVKLFLPDNTNQQPRDLLDHDYTPRVVVISNRHRTRAVDDDDIHSWEQSGWNEDPANDGNNYVAPPSSSRLARWQKPRTSLSTIASKLLRWVRSLQKHSCTDAENHVILDHHVHPPGHDDKPKRSGTRSGTTSPKNIGTTDAGHAGWIGKEATAGDFPGPPVSINTVDADSMNHSASPSAVGQDEEEQETRELS
jgi:hypothetical protein